jgi:hypothetical protein
MTLRESVYKNIPQNIFIEFHLSSIEDILDNLDKLYNSPNEILPDKYWLSLPKSGEDLVINNETEALVKSMSANLKEMLFCINYHYKLIEKIKMDITDEKLERDKISIYRYIRRIISGNLSTKTLKLTRKKLIKAINKQYKKL